MLTEGADVVRGKGADVVAGVVIGSSTTMEETKGKQCHIHTSHITNKCCCQVY